MGMKNAFKKAFLSLALGGLLAGCASPAGRPAVVSPPEGAPAVAAGESARAPGGTVDIETIPEPGAGVAPGEHSRAKRTLPARVAPGGTLEVAVRVFPGPGVTGVIIEEDLPADWTVLEAVPPVSRQAGRRHTWLSWGQVMGEYQLTYRVAVPASAVGEHDIAGRLKTMRDGNREIGGDRTVLVTAGE